MKKAISLFLVFSILLLSGNMFAKEKRGADLIIQNNDGSYVRGELIAVQENSLLLLDRDSRAYLTIAIADIQTVKIVKKTKFVSSAGIGFLPGAAAGVVTGIAFSGTYLGRNKIGESVVGGATVLGILGALVGGIVGIVTGIDRTIHFAGNSDSEIQEILEKLRKKARVRNAQ